MTELQRTILAAVDERGALTPSEITEAVDAHPITVDRVCDSLRSEGTLQTVEGGRYVLTDRGREQLGNPP